MLPSPSPIAGHQSSWWAYYTMLRRSKATSRETFLCLGTYAEAHVGLVYPWPGSYPLAIQFLTLHIGCATIGEGEEGLSAF